MHTLFEDFFIPAVKHSLLTTNSNCSLLLPLATVSPLAIFQYFSSFGSSFCISNTSAGVSFHSLSVGHLSGLTTRFFTSPTLQGSFAIILTSSREIIDLACDTKYSHSSGSDGIDPLVGKRTIDHTAGIISDTLCKICIVATKIKSVRIGRPRSPLTPKTQSVYNGVAMDVELQTFVGLSPMMSNDKRNSESVTVSLYSKLHDDRFTEHNRTNT